MTHNNGPNLEIPVIVVPVVGAGQIFTAGESAGERGLAARVRQAPPLPTRKAIVAVCAAQQSNPIHQIQVWLRKPVVINLGWEVIDFDFQVYTLSFLNSFYNLLYNSLYSQVFVLCRALVKKFLSEQKCKALQVKSIGFFQ